MKPYDRNEGGAAEAHVWVEGRFDAHLVIPPLVISLIVLERWQAM